MAKVNSFLGKRAATTRVQKARLPAVAPSARHPATMAGKATAPLRGWVGGWVCGGPAGRGAYHRQPEGSPRQPPLGKSHGRPLPLLLRRARATSPSAACGPPRRTPPAAHKAWSRGLPPAMAALTGSPALSPPRPPPCSPVN